MRSDLPELQAHVEHRLVHNAYALCDQNQVRTARLLGISRSRWVSLTDRGGVRLIR